MRGLFVTVEGPEGSGKSTQVARLCEAVRAAGRVCLCTREPGGGTPVGEAVRRLLKDPACWQALGLAEIWLYAAARADHLEQVIEPALARGEVVLCDRYLDSTLAYQGHGRGRPLDLIERLHALPPLDRRPDLTLLLDLEPEAGLARVRRRAPETDDGPGYDHATLAFHRRVRDGFRALAAAAPGRITVIDAARPEEAVAADVLDAVRPALDVSGGAP